MSKLAKPKRKRNGCTVATFFTARSVPDFHTSTTSRRDALARCQLARAALRLLLCAFGAGFE